VKLESLFIKKLEQPRRVEPTDQPWNPQFLGASGPQTAAAPPPTPGTRHPTIPRRATEPGSAHRTGWMETRYRKALNEFDDNFLNALSLYFCREKR
jgi:hypothetical protein